MPRGTKRKASVGKSPKSSAASQAPKAEPAVKEEEEAETKPTVEVKKEAEETDGEAPTELLGGPEGASEAKEGGGETLAEALAVEAEAAAANAAEEKALEADAEKRIKGMTETELERQLTFLLNQSQAFMGFMSKKLTDNSVKTSSTASSKASSKASSQAEAGDGEAEEEEEDKENAGSKAGRRGKKGSRGRKAKATMAEKDSAAGAAKAEAREAQPDEDPDGHNHIPVLFKNGSLRQYQVEGYQWMKTLFLSGLNGILADEMGLGKTVQTIAMVAHLYEMGFSTKGPVLVVAPLSTLPNWEAEFIRFTPDIPIVLYHGNKDARAEHRRKLGDLTSLRGELHYPVIITSYQMTVQDAKHLEPFHYVYFVMDEGHRIKNHKCQLLRALSRLNISDGRLLLTGTPLQNDLTELWSLLNFILPMLFDDLEWFTAYFDFSGGRDAVVEAERKKAMVSKLHSILKPILLRRMKSDVELNLPPKREIIVYAPLAEEQETIYRQVLQNAINAGLPPTEGNVSEDKILSGRRKRAKTDYAAILEEDDDAYLDSLQDKAKTFEEISEEFGEWESLAPKARKWTEGGQWRNPELDCQSRNALMLLRQVALHTMTVQLPTDAEGPYVPADERIVSSSGKMMVADQLLRALKERGHKCLIFSQFKGILDILEVYCGYRDMGYVRLDGSTALEDRAARIAKFNADEDTFIFLISTRAGNLGMNLCAADSVLIFDSDWNPQSDLQAQDRCHRIGQTRPVVVYRLTTRGTVDERIVETAISKRRVERTVIGGGRFNRLGAARDEDGVSVEDLAELLEQTDHSAVVDPVTGHLLSQDHLDSLLDRTFGHPQPTPAKASKGSKAKSPKADKADKFFKVIPTVPLKPPPEPTA